MVVRICQVYKEVWGPLHNFFLPCLKLKAKWREGSHWRKRYEPPQTAFDRLCRPGLLQLKERRQLRERYESLDPFSLKDELERQLKQILHPKPSSGVEGISPPPKIQVVGFRPQGARAEGSQARPPARFNSLSQPKLLPSLLSRNLCPKSPAYSDAFGAFFQ